MKALYVTDRNAAGEERVETVLRLLRDADRLAVQIREKEATDLELFSFARQARALLGPRVPLFVNRRFDVAIAAGADGVHLPAAGLPLQRVRFNTPRGFLVGVSAHSASETIAAIEQGADLVVLGPMFDTPSKRIFGRPIGPGELAKLPAASEHQAEVYAIGGIDEEKLREIAPWRERIAGIAAVRLFQETPDPRGLLHRIADT